MKNNLFSKVFSGLGFVLLTLSLVVGQMPGTVGAQEEEYVLEDTIVTATKTGETMLQETPMSITVFDDEQIKNLSSYDLEDLGQFMSSVLLRRDGDGTAAAIRGLGSGPGLLLDDNLVSFYIDGVYLHQAHGSLSDFLDVERIEVIRGPQGVLFGRNATGGAINIITKIPSDELELMGSVDIGNYGHRKVDAMISGPLVKDKLHGRLSVSDAKHDAYIDNLGGRDARDENYTAFRGSLQIIPSENVDIVFRGDYTKTDRGVQAPNKLINYDGFWGLSAGLMGIPSDILIPQDFHTVRHDLDAYDLRDEWGLSAHVTVDFSEDMTLTSITAYRNHSFSRISDDDGTLFGSVRGPFPRLPPAPIYIQQDNYDFDWYSQELQLTGTWGRFEWLIGGYYFDMETHLPIANVEFYWLDLGVHLIENLSAEAWAGFGNLEYAFTDKFSGSAGVRYSREEKTTNPLYLWLWARLPDGTEINLPPAPPDGAMYLDGEWGSWTPQLVLDYQATEDVLLYGVVSKGFKSGTISPGNLNVGYDPAISPETVWMYEVGMKSDWLDKRLRLNAAAFMYDYTDLITYQMIRGFPTQVNAGEVEVNGAELELLVRPTQRLTLNVGVTYVDAEYTEHTAEDPRRSGVFVDVTGNQLYYTSEWKAVFGANYVMPIKDYGYLTFGANLSWTDDYPCNEFADDPTIWVENHTLVNALARYETEDGHWSLEAYAKNLFEEEYYTSLLALGADTLGDMADPMTMGIKATYKY